MRLTDVVGCVETLERAAALESSSDHPVALAVVAAARERGIEAPEASGFHTVPGLGVRATVGGEDVLAGDRALMERSGMRFSRWLVGEEARLESEGKAVVWVGWNGVAGGLLGLTRE